MSAPPPPPLPPRSTGPGSGPRSGPRTGRSTATIVIAVALVVAVGLSGVGVAGLAAWSYFKDSESSDAGRAVPAPPEPSTTAQAPAYPSKLKRYYEQDLDWRSCGVAQCALLTVPLDYDHPGGKTIALAVLRLPAEQRAQRVGQLVVNPGGPGGSGVGYAAAGAAAFGQKVARYFDIVGFDPRGVGNSTRLECASTKQTDALLSADQDPDTPDEVSRLDQLTRKFGQGCVTRSGDLAKHLSTVEVVKDLDVLRAALGEPKLDYLGASYGTLIGATYADMFPTHVRRMVLDGAIDPALTGEQLALGQAKGFETALRAYLADCVAQGNCVLGDTVQAGSERLKQLLAQVDASPLPTSSERPLTQGLAVLGISEPLYVKQLWPDLTEALTDALKGNGDRLLTLSDRYTHRGPNGYTDNLMEVLPAVNCLDHSDFVPWDDVPRHFAEFEEVSPTFGRTFAYGLGTCGSWPVKSGKHAAAVDAKGAPPIVVVGTTRDPATPYAQAVSLARELESGVLVSRDGDGHTGFQQGNQCVDDAVETYLVAGAPPEDGLSC